MNKKISRRKFLTVLISIVSVIALCVFTACSKPIEPDYEVVKSDGGYGEKVFENMQYLAQNYPDRTMGESGELNAAKYIASKLSEWGYVSDFSDEDTQGLQSFKVNYMRYLGTSISNVNAYNVIFTKKAENSKGEIILSTQFDNLYSETNGGETWKADGSYESGSGSAVLLTLAQIMSEQDFDYDITFAFFSGGCYNWMGAYHYVSQLKKADVDNIKLNINFSMLGGGENLYLYTNESVCDFDAYLRKVGDGITANPKDKNVAPFTMETEPLYLFTHVGMAGNQYYLMNRKVATANFTSHNWSCNEQPFVTEIQGKSNVYHTSDDTLENMIARKGEESIKTMLNNVVNTVLNAMNKGNALYLDSALSVAKTQIDAKGQGARASSMAAIIIKIVVVAIFFGIALTVRNYVRKNQSQYIVKKESEQKEEIKPFDFDTYPKSDESDNGDEFIDKDGQNPPDDPFI